MFLKHPNAYWYFYTYKLSEVHKITEGIIPANALHHIAKTHDNQMSVSK